MRVITVPGERFSSNSFILVDEQEEKILIIDLGLKGAKTNYRLRDALETLGDLEELTEKEVEVFLTHCHADHILGADNLINFQKVQFSASEKTKEHINNQDQATLLSFFKEENIPFKVEKAYKNNEKITLGKRELQVIYCPGHTDGGTVIYEPDEQLLFSGDNVFASGSPGRTDLYTGDRNVLYESLGKIKELPIKYLYPGHGPNASTNIKMIIEQAQKQLQY